MVLSSKLSSRFTCLWVRAYFRGRQRGEQEEGGDENLHEIDALFLDSCLVCNVVIARQKVPHPCLRTVRARARDEEFNTHACSQYGRIPFCHSRLALQSLLDPTYFPTRTAPPTSSRGVKCRGIQICDATVLFTLEDAEILCA